MFRGCDAGDGIVSEVGNVTSDNEMNFQFDLSAMSNAVLGSVCLWPNPTVFPSQVFTVVSAAMPNAINLGM